MRVERHGVNPRLGTGLCCAALLLLLPALLAAPCLAADITLSSRTYLLYYERGVTGGADKTFAPFYEYLSGDANNLGGRPFSFHFYGWGRLDLADDTDDDGRGGDLASAYLQYNHPTGNAEMRLGRFFLAEGAAAEILDGIFLKGRTPAGLGLSVFGGVPVERTITSTDTGDSIYGGRLFFSRAGFAEIGVSYLKEEGKFQGDNRETVGGDLWLRPGIPVELSGRTTYNVSTSALSSQRYVLRILTHTRLDLAVGYDAYRFRDLFQTALHPAFLSPSIDNNDKVRTIFALADITIAEGVTLEAGVKQIRHDLADPGDALRGDLGIRVAYNGRKDLAGLSVALVSADLDENEYQEFRAFGSYSPGPFRLTMDALTHRYKRAVAGSSIKDAYQVTGYAGWQALSYLKISADLDENEYQEFRAFGSYSPGPFRLTLDALTHRYKRAVAGSSIKDAYQVTGSAGWQVASQMKVSGDLTYTRSPRFMEDYAGLVRVSLDLGTTTGGK